MFGSVLVANRGEIALRIFRTLRRLGVESVAVYSPADKDSSYTRGADRAVRLGGAPGETGAAAYLDVAAIVDAAVNCGAEAVHPGYGFLSENPGLARAVVAAGLAWIGPPAEAIEAMGDKITAKATVAGSGVPVVPGGGAPGMDDSDLEQVAAGIGYPVLIKPSAGGGGKGMRVVDRAGALAGALAAARREAQAAFGDATLLIERWVQGPRHIEIQVLADQHGAVLHLGERECSLQRRHQKVIEEAPSPLLAGLPEVRDRMGRAAVDAARSVGYVGAGTVEFVVPGADPSSFYFMEMNTRLQVEHPVTEAVTGLDLVEWQLRVAAGEALTFAQDEVASNGHAIEARVYAEDPARGFLPTGGPVLAWHRPRRPHVRVDTGIAAGDRVSSDFDPLLAKVVAWGPSRGEALQTLGAALGETVLLGVDSNIAFLRRLLAHPAVTAGDLDTGLIEREIEVLAGAGAGPEGAAAGALRAAALLRWQQAWQGAAPAHPWSVPSGWRMGTPAAMKWALAPSHGDPAEVWVRPAGRGAFHPGAPLEITLAGEGAWEPASARLEGGRLTVWLGGARRDYAWADDGSRLWLGAGGRAWSFEQAGPGGRGAGAGVQEGVGAVRSPMPGTVRAIRVAEGDRVEAGDELVVVEAMKMEYSVVAGTGGRVASIRVKDGQRVALDEVLVELEE